MTDAMTIARANVKVSLELIAAGAGAQFNALDGAEVSVLAADKIAYHSKFKSEAHRAAVAAWQEVLDAPEPAADADKDLAAAYACFTPGSTGFAIHIETHCGFGISRDEIKRISEKAATAAEFQAIWESSDFWADEVEA